MKRLAAILCVTGLVACTTEFSTKDTATDTSVDPGLDTTADTGVDVPVDTDTPDVPDDTAPTDTVVDTEPMDTYTDTALDTEPDGPICEPITDIGECNLVEQCGCPWGHYCTWDVNADFCTLYERCEPGTGGTLGIERTCFTPEDCAPGSVCLTAGGGDHGYCLKWCRDDSDCPVLSHPCNLSVALPTEVCGEVDPPLMLCGTGECMDEGCLPLDPTGCPDGETCAWDKLCDTLYCTPAGEAGQGEPCWEQFCWPGFTCIMGTDDVPRCAGFCTTDSDCADGTFCSSVGSIHSDVMICM